MEKFKLKNEQIEFLRKYYSNDELVKNVLDAENAESFTLDTDTYLDFMDYIEDQSVYWMGPNYEATQKTIMLESIRDDIYYQTN